MVPMMTSRDPSRLTPRTRSGFSLPEILIVIVMISVLALVAIPRFATANGKRHMESARMRVAAALATARQGAIQKGETIRFRISAANRVTVKRTGVDTTDLITPVSLDTLYKVTVSGVTLPFVVDYTSRGFANLSPTTIWLIRTGVPKDSLMITSTGMVRR